MSAGEGRRGSDQVVLRIPITGGTARAYIYPNLDSLVWSASGAPQVSRVLGFDTDYGVVAVVDEKGQPRRVDLRASEVRLASKEKLSSLSSANGSDIYGVTAKGSIARITPAGDWSFDPPSPARSVFPQPNGAIVIAGNSGSKTLLWLVRPPDEEIVETASLPLVSRGVRTQLGDRLYFTVDSGLIGVRTRDLSPVKSVRLDEPVEAVVPTPSGDRLYVATRGNDQLVIVDRYSEAIAGKVDLPSPAAELRMDPLGQYILAKPAAGGDSAWLIAIGTNRVQGTVQSDWRADLPAFAPGSTIAAARGGDVIFINSGNLRPARTVSGGAKDFWYFFTWNGFRPRSADLDRPVTFDSPAVSMPADSGAIPVVDSTLSNTPNPPLRDATPSMVPPPASLPAHQSGYMISFATVLTEQKANELVASIVVNGNRPRVLPAQSGSTTIYRVVLGPFGTREEADRVGRDSKRQYWVFQDAQ